MAHSQPPLFGPDFPMPRRDPSIEKMDVFWYHPEFTQSRYPPGQESKYIGCRCAGDATLPINDNWCIKSAKRALSYASSSPKEYLMQIW